MLDRSYNYQNNKIYKYMPASYTVGRPPPPPKKKKSERERERIISSPKKKQNGMHDIKVQLQRPPGDPLQCSAETECYNNNNNTTTTATATTTTLLKLTRLRNNDHTQGEQQQTHSEHRSTAQKVVVNQVLKVKVQGF